MANSVRKGLRARLLWLVGLALLPVLVVFSVSLYARYNAQVAQEQESNRAFAEATAATFSRYVDSIWVMEDVVGAAIVDGGLTPEGALSLLTAQLSAHPEMWSFAWMDPQGTVVAGTHPDAVGQSYGDREHIRRVMEGDTQSISDLMVSRVTGGLTIAVAHGIRRNGQLQGILVAGLDITKLPQVVPFSPAGSRTFGLVDSQDQLVYASSAPDLPMNARLLPAVTKMRPALREGPLVLHDIRSAVDGARRTGALVLIPGLNWIAYATVPTDAVLAGLRSDTWRTAGVLALLTVITLGVAHWLAGWVLRPVRALQAAIERQAGQQAALAALGQQALTSKHAQALLEEAAALVASALQVEYVAVWEMHPSAQRLRLIAGCGWPPDATGTTLPALALQTLNEGRGGRPAPGEEPPNLLQRCGIESALSSPLRSLTGQPGRLDAYTTGPRSFSRDEEHFLAAVANVLSTMAERARTARLVALQHACTRVLAASATLGQAASRLLQAVCDELGWDVGVLWLVDHAREVLACHSVWHAPGVDVAGYEARVRTMQLRPGEGLPGRVWNRGEPAWSVNVAQEFTDATAAPDDHLVSAFCFPVLHGREVHGVIKCFSTQLREPDADLLRTLANIGTQLGEFIERTRTQEQLIALNSELERRVDQRTAELAAANEELEAFCYSVSHDLRAPVRTVAGFSQALEEDFGPLLPHEGLDFLGRIRRAGYHMDQLIQDLLRLSRLTRGEMHQEPVDLSLVAWSIVMEMQRSHPGRRVNVEIQEGLQAYGDGRLIRVALENLLNNAWKFSEPVETPVVRFRAVEDGVFVVEDNGVGFDMAYAGKLFQPFQRLHSQSEFDGSGIGLATVRRVINRHGGRVWAVSSPGQGACFYFTLTNHALLPANGGVDSSGAA
ncbi:MAG TPA: ATP-binding protein [Symbiobacteriaceae bacterium]|nr:ATP-binding protein [Symbiobacteriaceae bacterium]